MKFDIFVSAASEPARGKWYDASTSKSDIIDNLIDNDLLKDGEEVIVADTDSDDFPVPADYDIDDYNRIADALSQYNDLVDVALDGDNQEILFNDPVYPMDDLDDLLSRMDPVDAFESGLSAGGHGDSFNEDDEYVTTNGYGNIISLSEDDLAEAVKSCATDLIDSWR